MATTKPLTLRRQRAAKTSSSQRLSTGEVQADVLVDTGVYHLSDPFSYLVPTDLSDQIRIGSVVNVPFASTSKLGIVLNLGPIRSAGLKSIRSIAHDIPIQPALLDLADNMVRSSICTPFDAYRFVLPVATKIDNSAAKFNMNNLRNKRPSQIYVQTLLGEDVTQVLLERLSRESSKKRLILFPTLRDVRRFLERCTSLDTRIIDYGSHLGVSARKRAFADIVNSYAATVVGTRSAIFAPLKAVDEIIIVDEWSEHYQEQKTPYWNARDLAFARAEIESCDLFFLSSTASLEVLNLIEQGKVIHNRRSRFTSIKPKFTVTCLPRPYIEVIRKSVKQGPVLVTVAEKNFSNLFICQKCRNVGRCGCGGRIIMAKRGEFICSLCSTKSSNWRCAVCNDSKIIMMRSGIEKVMEEISRSLPNVPVFLSTQDKETSHVVSESSVVISTSGMEPSISKGYAAVVLLDGEELGSRPFIRAEEDLLQRWLKSLQHIRRSGEIYLSLPSNHRIAQAIISCDPLRYLRTEYAERKKLSLPPTRAAIKIESKSESLTPLRNKLSKQFPQATINLSSNSFTIIMLTPIEELEECRASLRALQKVRSVQSKEIFKVSINPYHL